MNLKDCICFLLSLTMPELPGSLLWVPWEHQELCPGQLGKWKVRVLFTCWQWKSWSDSCCCSAGAPRLAHLDPFTKAHTWHAMLRRSLHGHRCGRARCQWLCAGRLHIVWKHYAETVLQIKSTSKTSPNCDLLSWRTITGLESATQLNEVKNVCAKVPEGSVVTCGLALALEGTRWYTVLRFALCCLHTLSELGWWHKLFIYITIYHKPPTPPAKKAKQVAREAPDSSRFPVKSRFCVNLEIVLRIASKLRLEICQKWVSTSKHSNLTRASQICKQSYASPSFVEYVELAASGLNWTKPLNVRFAECFQWGHGVSQHTAHQWDGSCQTNTTCF